MRTRIASAVAVLILLAAAAVYGLAPSHGLTPELRLRVDNIKLRAQLIEVRKGEIQRAAQAVNADATALAEDAKAVETDVLAVVGGTPGQVLDWATLTPKAAPPAPPAPTAKP